MAQGHESSEEVLADHLVRDAELPAQLSQGMGRMTVEAVVEDYHLAQVHRELIDDVVEASVSLAALDKVIEVRSTPRRIRGEDLLRTPLAEGYFEPDLVGDSGPGVGGEGGATFGVEALEGMPKANTTGLKQLSVGEAASVLAADDSVDEAFVVGQAWLVTCRGRG